VPGQSALTLLDALGGRRGRLPVVLLTGLINEDVQRLGHNAGAMSFLSKDDVSANTLDAVIRSTLHSHALETELHDTIVRRDEELRAQIDAFATITRDVERPLLRIDEAAAEIARSDGTAAEAARRIHNEVGKLRDVVRMLLDEVRADRQTVELRLEPLDLAEVVDKSLRLIGNGLAELKLSARVTKPDTSVIVIMDETAMLQALLNVLSNAIAFSPRGAGIDITIATAGEDDAADVFDAMTAIAGSVPDGPHAVVTVADRGPGMRPEAIDRLVDRSGGGRDETQRKGLGLSIVAAIVRQHGGHLAIAGRDGAGTRVRICLPLGDDRPLAE